jgi:hypothetical protein
MKGSAQAATSPPGAATTYIGQHVVRVFALEPLLVYIRFEGDVTIGEARALSHLVAQKIDGRGARFLVESAALGTICPGSRRELSRVGPELHPAIGTRVLDIIVVGASILQKVVLTQIVTMASLRPESRGQTHFFDALDDALAWLGVPVNLLS